jgi:hypothetical protein
MISRTPGLAFRLWRIAFGRRAAVLALLLVASSVGALRAQEATCPFPEQKPMLVTQLFFGRSILHRGPVTASEWNSFLRQHVTPLFPDGFTVYDGYGQWLSPQTHAISRDPTKVVVIATADAPEVRTKVAELTEIYRRLFHQEAVGVLSVTECGAF